MMASRSCLALLILTLGGAALAQTRVQTETITPSESAPPPTAPGPTAPSGTPGVPGASELPGAGSPPETQVSPQPATPTEIMTDLSRLPAPAARMRERILEAARSGDLEKLLLVMQSNETLPVFSFGDDKDPIAFWRANYPDSNGIEILAILIQILETGFVHIDRGTAQEMYVWPYFTRTPIKELTAPQKVELFRIVTGADYKQMKDFGSYVFYRVGIAPDGVWHFFLAGD
jgi:hypothetical protein